MLRQSCIALRHQFRQRRRLILATATLSAGVFLVVISAMAAEYRFWTAATGTKSKVKLEVVEQDDKSVRLKREDNGRLVVVPIEKLSREDRRYLSRLRATKAKATKPKRGPAANSASGNWPRFRGPDGLGVSTDRGLPLEWSDTKNIVWKTALPGPGLSSPITWGDHIYVTCYSGYGLSKESPGEMTDLRRHLICVNRNDGRILWQQAMPSKAAQMAYRGFVTHHGYTSSTPVADSSGVYVFYGTTGAAAYSHAGKLKWQSSCGTRVDGFGTAISPILHGDLVIVHADVEGKALIALDKNTGKEAWRVATNVPRGSARRR